MPFDDPTKPWQPPYTPTPQPQTSKEWWALVKWIWKALKKHKPRPEYPRCDRCGGYLEVAGFKGGEPVWACKNCN